MLRQTEDYPHQERLAKWKNDNSGLSTQPFITFNLKAAVQRTEIPNLDAFRNISVHNISSALSSLDERSYLEQGVAQEANRTVLEVNYRQYQDHVLALFYQSIQPTHSWYSIFII